MKREFLDFVRKSRINLMLVLTALSLLLVSVMSVTYCWIEGATSLTALGTAAVADTGKEILLDTTNGTSNTISLKNYIVNSDNLFLAPAKLAEDGVTLQISNDDGSDYRNATTNDIGNNYVEFDVKINCAQHTYFTFTGNKYLFINDLASNALNMSIMVDGKAVTDADGNDVVYNGTTLTAVTASDRIFSVLKGSHLIKFRIWLDGTTDVSAFAGKTASFDFTLKANTDTDLPDKTITFVDVTANAEKLSLTQGGSVKLSYEGLNSDIPMFLAAVADPSGGLSYSAEVPIDANNFIFKAYDSAGNYVASWTAGVLSEDDLMNNATYTAYGNTFATGGGNGTWGNVIKVNLNDFSYDSIFSNAGSVSVYSSQTDYMYSDSENHYISYLPAEAFAADKKLCFNAGSGDNAYYSEALASDINDLASGVVTYSIYGKTDTIGTDNNDMLCYGTFCDGADLVTFKDLTNKFAVRNNSDQLMVNNNGGAYYYATYDSTEQVWKMNVPSDIYTHYFRSSKDTTTYTFDGSERKDIDGGFNGPYIYTATAVGPTSGTWDKIETVRTTIYFENRDYEKHYAYVYNSNEDTGIKYTPDWPGSEIFVDEETGYYVYTFESRPDDGVTTGATGKFRVMINDGGNSNKYPSGDNAPGLEGDLGGTYIFKSGSPTELEVYDPNPTPSNISSWAVTGYHSATGFDRWDYSTSDFKINAETGSVTVDLNNSNSDDFYFRMAACDSTTSNYYVYSIKNSSTYTVSVDTEYTLNQITDLGTSTSTRDKGTQLLFMPTKRYVTFNISKDESGNYVLKVTESASTSGGTDPGTVSYALIDNGSSLIGSKTYSSDNELVYDSETGEYTKTVQYSDTSKNWFKILSSDGVYYGGDTDKSYCISNNTSKTNAYSLTSKKPESGEDLTPGATIPSALYFTSDSSAYGTYTVHLIKNGDTLSVWVTEGSSGDVFTGDSSISYWMLRTNYNEMATSESYHFGNWQGGSITQNVTQGSTITFRTDAYTTERVYYSAGNSVTPGTAYKMTKDSDTIASYTPTVTGTAKFTVSIGSDGYYLTISEQASVGDTNKYYYRGYIDGTNWTSTAMTVSDDGYYEYISLSGNNRFRIGLSSNSVDYSNDCVTANFNNTDVANIGHYDNVDAYCWQSGSYYVLVYYPNTAINTTSRPIICASTTLPNNTSSSGGTKTIYVNCPSGWNDLHCYFFSGSSTVGTDWPGSYMNAEGNSVYSITVPDGATGMIFNNGDSGPQTVNIEGDDLKYGYIYTILSTTDSSGHYNVSSVSYQ